MKGSPILCSTLLAAGLIGCASATSGRGISTAADVSPPKTDPIGSGPLTVEVRDYAAEPTVSIVGWSADEAAYGLRTWVRRDGSASPDHRLYVSTYYVAKAPQARGVVEAIYPPGRMLQLTGVSRDDHACDRGTLCSPYETFGVRVPDALLRANRDSLAVRLYSRNDAELIVTIRKDLIDAYLGAVDSVTAALRKK